MCDPALPLLQLSVGLENLKLLKIVPLDHEEVYISIDVEEDKVLVLLGLEHADVKEICHDLFHCLLIKSPSHKVVEERTII